jgi:SCO1/SenC
MMRRTYETRPHSKIASDRSAFQGGRRGPGGFGRERREFTRRLLSNPERLSAARAERTPVVIKDYLSSFDPHLSGLTGDPAGIAAVAKAYREGSLHLNDLIIRPD